VTFATHEGNKGIRSESAEGGAGKALMVDGRGTYLDMCANLPVVDPLGISCPVMVIRGEFDGIAGEEDLFAFFSALPNKDKQFAILPGQAHVAPLGVNRHRFWHVMENFLTMPARVDGAG